MEYVALIGDIRLAGAQCRRDPQRLGLEALPAMSPPSFSGTGTGMFDADVAIISVVLANYERVNPRKSTRDVLQRYALNF